MACFEVQGDLMLTADRRSIVLVTGPQRLKQRMRVGIHTLLGQYKYNVNSGIPWLTWLDKSQRVPIESELRKHFLSYPEVQAVTSLKLTVDKRSRVLFVAYVLQLKSAAEITDTVDIAQVIS
jgi:hypothetical protein